ncbi:hypothetical protein Scep_023989 [Stephania cephalantha]|uniref:Uncharacterized protein n=1 Tax=Stephania cephalantha TaxID=152367 RepID=A0AAP0HXZ0_9MAGN
MDASISSSVPIIDLHLLYSPNSSTQQKQDEIEKLKSALTSWGLFQAIGHEIPSSLLDDSHEMVKGIFDLSMGENKKKFLNEYSLKCNFVAEFVLKVMAESLGLEEDYFLKQMGERGAITLVLQDKEVEGLQVFKDGKWIKVPILPNLILINVADQVEIMSNGVYKSPVHRVITN